MVTLNLSNGTMTENRAALGAAISVQYLSTVTLQSCIVDQNQGMYNYTVILSIIMFVTTSMFYSTWLWWCIILDDRFNSHYQEHSINW